MNRAMALRRVRATTIVAMLVAGLAGCGLGSDMQGTVVAPLTTHAAVSPWDTHLPSYQEQVNAALKRWSDADTGHFFETTHLGEASVSTVSGDYRLSTSESITETNPRPGHPSTIYVAITTSDTLYFGTRPGGPFSSCWVETDKLPPAYVGFPDAVAALAGAHGIRTHGGDVSALTNLYVATNAMSPRIARALPVGLRSADVPITIDIEDGEVSGWALDFVDVNAALVAADVDLPTKVKAAVMVALRRGAGLTVVFNDVGNSVSMGLTDSRPVVQRSDPDLDALCVSGAAPA